MTVKPMDMYKSVVGWAEYKPGDEKREPTHKLVSNEEWVQLANYMNLLKKKIKEKDQSLRDKDAEIGNIRDEYDIEITAIKKKAAEDALRLQTEVERQMGLNENLLRITRERVNAKRGLQPKKKHLGYRYIGKITQIKVVKERSKKDGNIYGSAWTATMETPYDVTVPLTQIKDRIDSDLFGEFGICSKIHIHILPVDDADGKKKVWTGEYLDLPEKLIDGDNGNYLYDLKYSANPKSRLWEVQLFTTSAIEALPELLV